MKGGEKDGSEVTSKDGDGVSEVMEKRKIERKKDCREGDKDGGMEEGMKN